MRPSCSGFPVIVCEWFIGRNTARANAGLLMHSRWAVGDAAAPRNATPPRPTPPPLQIMHRFHFSSVLKRMSTIVEAEGDAGSRCRGSCVQ